MSEEVWHKIHVIFKKVFENDRLEITKETGNNDIDGWNSLSHALLIEALEKEFNITFEFDEVLNMHNVGEIYQTLGRKLS